MTVEENEPVFHDDWEGRVIAGILATIGAGLYNVDQFREQIDEIEPLAYIELGYYRRWLHTLEANCVRTGVFTPEEIERRMDELASGDRRAGREDPAVADGLRTLIKQGAPTARPVDRGPAYAADDAVRGRVLPAARHARIPGYVQGRPGVVESVHEAFPQPDSNRSGQGENPEHVYSVAFRASDLWEDGDPSATILVDLWESYLEPDGDR